MDDFPDEMIYEITSHIDKKWAFNLSLVNWSFHRAIQRQIKCPETLYEALDATTSGHELDIQRLSRECLANDLNFHYKLHVWDHIFTRACIKGQVSIIKIAWQFGAKKIMNGFIYACENSQINSLEIFQDLPNIKQIFPPVDLKTEMPVFPTMDDYAHAKEHAKQSRNNIMIYYKI